MENEATVNINGGERVYVVRLGSDACEDWLDFTGRMVIESGVAMDAKASMCSAYEIWRGTECVMRGKRDEDAGGFGFGGAW